MVRKVGAMIAIANRVVAIALALACAMVLFTSGAEARRVALVVGNSGYALKPLANPGNDAAAVAAVFKDRLGFEHVDLKTDLTRAQMVDALRAFESAAAGAEVAVLYFAGHGAAVEKIDTYLIPVDARLDREADLADEAIGLTSILRRMDGVQGLRLIILDACRNPPFALGGRTRGAARGLARIEPEDNTLVAYATKDGTTADDGSGAHSPFTAALLNHLPTPDTDVRLVFGNVRDEVMTLTGRRQQPHVYGTLGGKPIYLRRTTEGVSAAPAAAPPVALLAPPPPEPPAAEPPSPADAPPAVTTAADMLARVLPAMVTVRANGVKPAAPPAANQKASDVNIAAGFFVSSAGLVVTGHSAVAGARSIEVELSDGTRHEARLAGSHAETDLALLRLSTSIIHPALAFAKRNPREGETVIAIGTPFGLSGSARVGQITRWQKVTGSFESLETSALIAKGDTGGVLVDLDGSVVGVIFATSEQKLGYATPGTIAAEVVDQLTLSDAVSDVAAFNAAVSRARTAIAPPPKLFDLDVATDVAQRAQAATVYIDANDGGNKTALGTGVLISADGYVVTTNTAISKSNDLSVRTSDGRVLSAKRIGTDARTDLALLKVDGASFGFAKLSDSPVRPGDVVFFATGLLSSARTNRGVISALARDIGSGPYDVLQTDARLDRGDHGSGLFSRTGELIGIGSSIYSPTGNWAGLAFAIPASIVNTVANQLMKAGTVARGWLGVKIQNTNEDIAAALELGEPTGAMISEATKGAPGEAAGLRPQDVVLNVDGQSVADSRALARRIAEFAPDTAIKLDIFRGGQRLPITVRLGTFPAAPPTEAAVPQPKAFELPATIVKGQPVADLGLDAVPLSAHVKGGTGIVIVAVQSGGGASLINLKRNDVITEVGDVRINRPLDVTAALDKAKRAGRQAVLLTVSVENQSRFYAYRLKK